MSNLLSRPLLTLAGAVMIAGCGSFSQSGGSSVTQPQDTTGVTATSISLGAWVPANSIGDDFKFAADSAFQEVNDRGGINGRKVNWITENDDGQPAKSLAAAKKLVEQDKVLAIFGGFGSPQTLTVAPYLQDNKVPLISPLAPVRQLSSPVRPDVFMTQTSFHDLGSIWIENSITNEHATSIAWVRPNEDTGKEMADGATKTLALHNLKPAADESYDFATTTDFTPIVLRLKQVNPDHVAVFGPPPAVAKILQAGLQLGLKTQWGFLGTADQLVIQLPGKASEGIQATSQQMALTDPSIGKSEYVSALTKYHPQAKPSSIGVGGYAMAKLMIEALSRGGKNLSRQSLVAGMNGIKGYQTSVFAPFTYSAADHAGSHGAVIYTVTNGQFVAKSNGFVSSPLKP